MSFRELTGDTGFRYKKSILDNNVIKEMTLKLTFFNVN